MGIETLEKIGFIEIGPGTDKIQQAVSDLPATGGLIRLKPGTYSETAKVTMNKPNIVIRGAGLSTTVAFSGFDTVGNAGAFDILSDGCEISSLHATFNAPISLLGIAIDADDVVLRDLLLETVGGSISTLFGVKNGEINLLLDLVRAIVTGGTAVGGLNVIDNTGTRILRCTVDGMKDNCIAFGERTLLTECKVLDIQGPTGIAINGGKNCEFIGCEFETTSSSVSGVVKLEERATMIACRFTGPFTTGAKLVGLADVGPRIETCHFKDCVVGVHLATSGAGIVSCQFDNCGVSIKDDGVRCPISSCTIDMGATSTVGIDISNGSDHLIDNCVIWGANTTSAVIGIRASFAQAGIIRGCTIGSFDGTGIAFGVLSRAFNVIGNRFLTITATGGNGNAIEVTGVLSDGPVIEGNSFDSISGHGVELVVVGLKNAVVNGNRFTTVAGDGVRLDGVVDCTVNGNHFSLVTGTEVIEVAASGADFNFVHGNHLRGGTVTLVGAGSVGSDNF